MTLAEWRVKLHFLERAERTARAAARGAHNPWLDAAARAAENAVGDHWDQHPDYLSEAEKTALSADVAVYHETPTHDGMLALMARGVVWPEMKKWRADAEHPEQRATRLAARAG